MTFFGVPGAYFAYIPEQRYTDAFDTLPQAIERVESSLSPFRKIAAP